MAQIIPADVAYSPGTPRVFIAFEDRKRDLSALMAYGTVLQIFKSEQRWQINSTKDATDLEIALYNFFYTHGFTDDDYIVAVGDPLVITSLIAAAGYRNYFRVPVLKWDRVPCPTCRLYTRCPCPERELHGRYVPVVLRLQP